MMRYGLLYFVAAFLFAVATCLNLYSDGLNLKTGIGLVFIVSMTMLGIRARAESRRGET